MSKLLDDAKAAGFYVESDKVISDTFHINITEKLAKFAALQQPKWISVKDRFPPGKIDIVLTTQYGNIPSFMIFKHDNWYYWPEIILSSSEPSHWMPLPIPPTNTEVT